MPDSRWLYTLPLRLRSLLFRRQVDQELDEELRDHLDHQIRELVSKGMPIEEARRNARRTLGGTDLIKEQCRDARKTRFAAEFWQNLRYGARTLMKSFGFTAAAVLTLALGVGANSAVFSVIDAVLLRPLPLKDSPRLARIYTTAFGGSLTKVTSRKDFLDWQNESRTFEQLGIYGYDSNTLTGLGQPRKIDSIDAGPGFFELFGVAPIAGRTFLPQEFQPNSSSVALLGEGFWKQQLGGSTDVIGRSIILDGKEATVVGILPDSLEDVVGKIQVWLPFLNVDENRGHRNYWAVGRLKPGYTIKQANSEMSGIAARLERAYHDSNYSWGTTVVSLQDSIVGDVRLMLLVLLGAVGLLLLIACANVTNLLLARAARRSQEIAVRAALGASRGRLVRQLLTESLLLSTLGGSVAVALALVAVKFLSRISTDYVPRIDGVRLDINVLIVTLILSVVATLVFGLAPALRLSSASLNDAMKEIGRGRTGSRRQNRFRSVLVVAELAISLVLLVGCGLLIRSFHRLGAVNAGFDADGLTKAQVALAGPAYKSRESLITFYNKLLAGLQTMPQAESAALGTTLPLGGNGYTPWDGVVAEGRPRTPEETIDTQFRQISPGYFTTMRIPLIQGRDFTNFDLDGKKPVVIVSRSLAEHLWPNENPLGKRIPDVAGKTVEVIGVAGDIKLRGLDSPDDIACYLPLAQVPTDYFTIVVKSSAQPSVIAGEVNDIVGSIDKDLPVYAFGTMDEVRSRTLGQRRFNIILLSTFAGLALLLSAVGTYGVVSYSVSERVQEIGVRMALGADRGNVVSLVVGQVLKLSAIAIVVGLVGAAGITRILQSLLFHVSPTDPLVFCAVSIFLAAVAAASAYLPARKATRIDPLSALRYQ